MTPNVYDLNSAVGVRQIVTALFQGYNYRLYTEGQTRNQLLDDNSDTTIEKLKCAIGLLDLSSHSTALPCARRLAQRQNG